MRISLGQPVCLIPARGHSKRIPRKNLSLLNGKPMLAYAIEDARQSGIFRRVVVSTEDPTIAAVAEQYGAEVPYLRPAQLAEDQVGIAEVAVEFVQRLRESGERVEVLGILLPSAPLRTAQDIRAAWELFCATDAPVLHSVTDFEHPPQRAVLLVNDGVLRPMLGLSELCKQSQEFPRSVQMTGAVIFVRTDYLLRTHQCVADRMLGYVMPRERSVDVDEPYDLVAAQLWLANRESAAAHADPHPA